MNKQDNWAVIFDVDGTMVDNLKYHRQAWIELCSRHNTPITAEFYQTHIHARSNENILRTIFGNNISAELITKLGDEKESIYREAFKPVIKQIPGLIGLLKSLKEQAIPCAAASNSPKANVDMVLDELGLWDYFAVVINCDQVRNAKPDPEIFLTIASQLGVQPAKCIAFEDSGSGFSAAERAGIAYIAIESPEDPQALKLAQKAKAVHSDFTKINVSYLKTIVS